MPSSSASARKEAGSSDHSYVQFSILPAVESTVVDSRVENGVVEFLDVEFTVLGDHLRSTGGSRR